MTACVAVSMAAFSEDLARDQRMGYLQTIAGNDGTEEA
jgi:hypothetical protein